MTSWNSPAQVGRSHDTSCTTSGCQGGMHSNLRMASFPCKSQECCSAQIMLRSVMSPLISRHIIGRRPLSAATPASTMILHRVRLLTGRSAAQHYIHVARQMQAGVGNAMQQQARVGSEEHAYAAASPACTHLADAATYLTYVCAQQGHALRQASAVTAAGLRFPLSSCHSSDVRPQAMASSCRLAAGHSTACTSA